MITKREITCITCPMGCNMTVTLEDNKVIKVEGNTCKRGEVYANTECTNPVRTLTSVMFAKNGAVLSVKTDKPIPKDKIFECVEIIKTKTAENDTKIGDIIIKNIADTGSDIVATKSL